MMQILHELLSLINIIPPPAQNSFNVFVNGFKGNTQLFYYKFSHLLKMEKRRHLRWYNPLLSYLEWQLQRRSLSFRIPNEMESWNTLLF